MVSTAINIVPLPNPLSAMAAGKFPERTESPEPLCPPKATSEPPSVKSAALMDGFPFLSISDPGSIA